MNRLAVPSSLNQLIDAAGVDAALTLVAARRGTRFWIPKKAEGSELAKIVGIDDARKIVEELANERIEIPVAKRILNRWLRERGASQEARANKIGVSRRTVQNWDAAEGARVSGPQPDLFDAAG